MGPHAPPRAGGAGTAAAPSPSAGSQPAAAAAASGSQRAWRAAGRPDAARSSLRADPGAAPLCSPARLRFPAGAGRLPSDLTEPLTCEHADCHFSAFSTTKAARGVSVLPGGRFSPAPPRRRPPLLPLPRPGSARGIASHRHFPASRSSWEVSDLLSAQKEEELLGGAFHFSLLPFYWLLDDFYSLSLIQEETAESLGELHY